ncbi:MAG TPA: hypothetical protein VFW28_06590 [Micropepsaceae bacterium]|nr:hypothetical protein [Micropepsaceae bacterium]
MKRDSDEGGTEQRLRKLLQGAFAGPPTQLKDVPTKEGRRRKVAKKAATRRRKHQ